MNPTFSKFRYGGPDCNLGRFGNVTTGQFLWLNQQESDYVTGDPNYFPLPVRAQPELKIATDTTLTGADSGKKIVCLHGSSGITVTLNPTPAVGEVTEVSFGNSGATGNVTVARAGHTIEGEATDYVLTAVADSVELVWTGATWHVL